MGRGPRLHKCSLAPPRGHRRLSSAEQRAESDCFILSGNKASHPLVLPKPQAWAGTACSLPEAGQEWSAGDPLPPKPGHSTHPSLQQPRRVQLGSEHQVPAQRLISDLGPGTISLLLHPLVLKTQLPIIWHKPDTLAQTATLPPHLSPSELQEHLYNSGGWVCEPFVGSLGGRCHFVQSPLCPALSWAQSCCLPPGLFASTALLFSLRWG